MFATGDRIKILLPSEQVYYIIEKNKCSILGYGSSVDFNASELAIV